MNLEGKITDLSLEITTTNYKTGQRPYTAKKSKGKIHEEAAEKYLN